MSAIEKKAQPSPAPTTTSLSAADGEPPVEPHHEHRRGQNGPHREDDVIGHQVVLPEVQDTQPKCRGAASSSTRRLRLLLVAALPFELL